MIDINFEKECYGCGLCEAVCPKQCIELKEDEKGFLKAYIDKTKCINCGICDKKCIATYRNPGSAIHAKKAFYGYNSDPEKRNSGTSGGVFFEIAAFCLKQGFLVSGCIWDEHWNPVHVLTDNIKIVEKMQRSKYSQSNIAGVLEPIKKALNEGRKVLFSGTPCQIAAVRSFVGERKNLICVGVICHGVASRKIWRMYLDSLRNQYGEIADLRMREKSGLQWSKYSLFVEFEDGKKIILSKPENGQFMQCFQESLYVSARCTSCQYKGDSISADIIIGDGWGQNPIAKSMDDGKGLSCVLLLTQNGVELWDCINHNFIAKEATAEMVAQGNTRLILPSKKNPRTRRFYRAVKNKGVVDAELLKKYMYINTTVAKTKKIIRKFLGK